MARGGAALFDEAMPTTAEMQTWAAQLDGSWGGLDTAQQQEENIYFQDFPVWTPTNVEPLRTGSAPADANGAIDSLVPKDVQIRVRPRRGRQKYITQAEQLVLAGQGMLYIWRRRKDILPLLAADQTIRRVAVARVMLDRARWPEVPEDLDDAKTTPPAHLTPEQAAEWREEQAEQRDDWEARYRHQFPIMFEWRNPRYVRWREGSDGTILVVVEKFTTTALEAKAAYTHPAWQASVKALLKDKQPGDPVIIEEVWYKQWRSVFFDNNPVAPIGKSPYRGVFPHLYPEIPYLIAPFRELPFEEPEHKYRGLLSETGSLYPLECEMVQAWSHMIRWNGWRSFVGFLADDRDIEIVPGRFIKINKNRGEWLEMLRGEPATPELVQTMSLAQSYLQRNGVAVGPLAGEATRSAQQVWALQSSRQLKLERPKEAG